MSRFEEERKIIIAFGFDESPACYGYFLQVYYLKRREEEFIVNEECLSNGQMLDLMINNDIGTEEQRQKVALDLKI